MSPSVTHLRAGLALAWAAALVLAVGDRVPSTGSEVPVLAAALLTAYPLIDVVASLIGAGRDRTSATALRVNAAVGGLAVVAIGVTAFGADAGSAMAAFGAWAVLSGAIQFGVAVRGDRSRTMLVSGGLSAVAGLGFLSSAGMDEAHLAGLAGYMAFGAVLYLIGARRPVQISG